MLMGAVDRGVHAERPVDLSGRVRVGEDLGVDPIPGAVPAEPTMPLPHRLPGTIPVGEISPRDSGAVPVDDALYNAAAITKRAAFTALIRWQKWFNSLPLCIRELRKSRPL